MGQAHSHPTGFQFTSKGCGLPQAFRMKPILLCLYVHVSQATVWTAITTIEDCHLRLPEVKKIEMLTDAAIGSTPAGAIPRVKPHASGTTLEQEFHARALGIAAKIMAVIMIPLILESIRKMIQGDLDAIKLHCETKA